ncbi:MAG: tryptophan-rich sensory protein [Gammaproteobacteria bacterium]|nr:tryptophan-rich sensory protein [Gammaproteobacteria bacterium]
MMSRSVSDWGGNIVAFVGVLVVNAMASALPINGQTTGEISARYPSLFTPAGLTFAIWGLIYFTLLLFVIYQALPAQRNNPALARIGSWFKLNCLANALWIVAWHYDFLVVSLLLMLAILVTLIIIYRSLDIVNPVHGFFERLFIQLPFSLYTGWVTVATIANISAVQTGMGWDDVGLSAVQWTLVKLAIAGAIGASVILRRSDMVYALVVAWAAYGISLKQVATPAVASAATTLALLAVFLVFAEALRRLRIL